MRLNIFLSMVLVIISVMAFISAPFTKGLSYDEIPLLVSALAAMDVVSRLVSGLITDGGGGGGGGGGEGEGGGLQRFSKLALAAF